MKTIKLPCFDIVIQVNEEHPDGGSISSLSLKEPCPVCQRVGRDYNAAIDGIEALVLAHACAGVDVESPEYIEGIETVVDKILNDAS